MGKYMDFCLDAGTSPEEFVDTEYDLVEWWKYKDWKNEISSIWCGSKVIGKLCYDEDPSCANPHTTVSNQKNEHLDNWDNQADKIKLEANTSDPTPAILYENSDCTGR